MTAMRFTSRSPISPISPISDVATPLLPRKSLKACGRAKQPHDRLLGELDLAAKSEVFKFLTNHALTSQDYTVTTHSLSFSAV